GVGCARKSCVLSALVGGIYHLGRTPGDLSRRRAAAGWDGGDSAVMSRQEGRCPPAWRLPIRETGDPERSGGRTIGRPDRRGAAYCAIGPPPCSLEPPPVRAGERTIGI